MSITATEITTQPAMWRLALEHVDRARELLAAPGERVLVIGC